MEQQKQLHLIMEWDLQWFAKDGPGGEKTEPATAKKLREAREDGKVVKSKELTAAFDLIILFLVLKIFVSFVGNRLMNSFVDIYGRIPDFVRENAVDVTEKLCRHRCSRQKQSSRKLRWSAVLRNALTRVCSRLCRYLRAQEKIWMCSYHR